MQENQNRLISSSQEIQLKSFSKTRSIWTSKLLTVFFFLVISILFLYTEAVPFWAGYYGSTTQATIVQKWIVNGAGTSIRNGGTSIKMRLEYNLGVTDLGVASKTYELTEVGQKVNIHYFPWAPKSPSIDIDQPTGVNAIFELCLQLFFVLLTPGVSIYQLLLIRKQKNS
jgi:hypothetical protein